MTRLPQVTTDPMPCARCGQPHARCAAHRRDGTPCTQWPMHGQRICRMHGGLKRAARANAEERQADAAVEATVRRLYYDPDAPPLKDIGAALLRLAGALEQMIDRLARELDDGLETAPDRLRAKAIFWEKLLGHFRQLLVEIARLRLGERIIELEEGQAKLTAAAFNRSLDAIDVTEEQRETAIRVLLSELRSVAALEEDGAA
jgi:hypothetical protein